jgi:hypothetical protein
MAGSSDDEGDADLTANPGGMFADKGDPQSGRSRDWAQGAGMGGTKAQDHADRRGKAGSGMVDAGGPIEGNKAGEKP